MHTRLLALSLALLATGALATPAAGTGPLPLAPPAAGSIPALPGGGAAGAFNPLAIALHPVEAAMSNGERLRRGLPPKRPHFRRAADRTGRARARPSAAPGASTQSTGCAPRAGVLHVTAPAGRGEDRPALDGYVARTANEFGEYGYTTARSDALGVTINNCTGSPFDIVSSNGFQAYPYVGGIAGFANDSPDLRAGSLNYVYIGGVTETDPRSAPQNAGNSFTAATNIQEGVESAIWSFRDGGDVLDAQWINSDGSSPTNRLVYVPSEGVFVLVGDVGAFESTFGPVSEATFRFEA